MLNPSKPRPQQSLFFTLGESLDQRHPLYILANKIDWQIFEREFHPLYCHDNGRPAKPIRLMVGLLILKHARNISDESVVEQCSENLYCQYFCGGHHFVPGAPCQASDPVHFRHRIGEKGIEPILRESVRVNNDDTSGKGDRRAFIDSTVQEKNITFPTDAKLYGKIIQRCLKIAEVGSLPAASDRVAVTFSLSAGQCHDALEGRKLIERLKATESCFLLMDRAYEDDATRELAAKHGFTPVVPPKKNRKNPWEYDKELYKCRNEVERLFRRIKRFRRVFTQYEKLDVMFLAFLTLAMITDVIK